MNSCLDVRRISGATSVPLLVDADLRRPSVHKAYQLHSPVGLSSMTKLSPRKYVGQMMGIWFLATAVGNLIAGLQLAFTDAIRVDDIVIVEAILRDERAVLPVSTVLDDVYGVSGVALSVPSIVSSEGAVPIGGLDLAPSEREAFERSAAAVRRVADDLRG